MSRSWKVDTVSREHWAGTDKLNILFVPINAPSFDNSLITKNACLKNVIFQKYAGRPLLGAWGIKTKFLFYTFPNIFFLLKNCIHNMIHGKGKVPSFLNILHCKKASIFALLVIFCTILVTILKYPQVNLIEKCNCIYFQQKKNIIVDIR